MRKGICACLLAVLILLQGTGVFAMEETEALSLLSQLGVMQGYEDGGLHPERNVSRAEYMAMLMRTLGFEEIAGTLAEERFADVPVTHWAAGYIRLAYDLGLIDGYDERHFAPEDQVTVNQAVKIMVCALGYGEAAEMRGEYPGGYLSQAEQLKLLKGITPGDSPATRGQIAVLLTNGLETEMLELRFTDGREAYAQGESTLLSILNVTIVEGLVDGVNGASVSGGRGLEENEVSIGGRRYETSVSDSTRFFAKMVKAYVREETDGEETVIYMTEKRQTDDSLVISADDLVPEECSLSELVFWDGDKERTQALDGSMTYVYNGGAVSTAQLSSSLFDIESGSVSLYDTNGSGSFDLAVVWDYETLAVTSVSRGVIYGRFGKRLDTEDKGIGSIRLERGGKAVTAEEIVSDDVLWIAKSLDGKYVSVLASEKAPVTGTLEMIDEGEPAFYTIDGERYQVSESYLQAAADGADGYERIGIGDGGMFLLDCSGKIAAALPADMEESRTGDTRYGYLTAMETGDGIGGAVRFKIMTEDNRFETFEIPGDSRIEFGRLVGGNYTKASMTGEGIFGYITANGGAMRLITYKQAEDGALRGLYLPGVAGDHENFSKDVNSFYGYYSNGVVDQKYLVDSQTVVFRIPNGSLYEEDFSVTKAHLLFSNGSRYPMELYDVDHLHARAAVVTDKLLRYISAEDGNEIYIDKVNSPVMLIERVYEALGDNGASYLVVEGYEGDGKKSVLVSDSLSAQSAARKDLHAGAVIQYETNDVLLERAEYSGDDRVMAAYIKMFDCTDETASYFRKWDHSTTSMPNAPIGTVYGRVERYQMPQMVVSTLQNGTETEAPLLIDDGAVVMRYNRGKDKIELLRHEDINAGQEVFIWQRYNNTRMVIILE